MTQISESESCGRSSSEYPNGVGLTARTEKTYVRGLEELSSIYIQPSSLPVRPGHSETIIPLSERKAVYGGIDSILAIHRTSLLPALEKAVTPILDSDDEALSAACAHTVGNIFRTICPHLRSYSAVIQNFDLALARVRMWSASSTKAIGPAIAAVGSSAMVSTPSETLSTSQRRRIQQFMRRAKDHEHHGQLNLESYLLTIVQRLPRYRLLLEDLAMSTPPSGTRDTIDDSLAAISELTKACNEEKRQSESRMRLYHFQQRIRARTPSPLVQPHRRLIMDGNLRFVRLVQKRQSFVEVDTNFVADGESTIMPTTSIVPVEHLKPEPSDIEMTIILCSDLMVLVQGREGDGANDGSLDLYQVLRMNTMREPACLVGENVLRVVDAKVRPTAQISRGRAYILRLFITSAPRGSYASLGSGPSTLHDNDESGRQNVQRQGTDLDM
jgi:hypothetical protein